MKNEKIDNAVNQYLNPKIKKQTPQNTGQYEECDLQTGECYVIRTKDGIVERINKKYITDDGRQLLQD
jgi:hypothetical protein